MTGFKCHHRKNSRITRKRLRTKFSTLFQRVLRLKTQMFEAIESCVNYYGNLKQSQLNN